MHALGTGRRMVGLSLWLLLSGCSPVEAGRMLTDAQAELAPEGEYESEVDRESLAAFGVTTLEAATCGGAEFASLAWDFVIHEGAASFLAAYERLRGVPSRYEIDFETQVALEVHAGEVGGCGEYVELTGVRDAGEVIEVGARFVAVNGDDGIHYPYLFALAPRADKPYVVVQEQPRCPPSHAGDSVTLQCRDEESRQCAWPTETGCAEGDVRVLPQSSICTVFPEQPCPGGEGCLSYEGLPLDTEAGCWREPIPLDCTPLPERCLSGECTLARLDDEGCNVELATGTQFRAPAEHVASRCVRAGTERRVACAAAALRWANPSRGTPRAWGNAPVIIEES